MTVDLICPALGIVGLVNPITLSIRISPGRTKGYPHSLAPSFKIRLCRGPRGQELGKKLGLTAWGICPGKRETLGCGLNLALSTVQAGCNHPVAGRSHRADLFLRNHSCGVLSCLVSGTSAGNQAPSVGFRSHLSWPPAAVD